MSIAIQLPYPLPKKIKVKVFGDYIVGNYIKDSLITDIVITILKNNYANVRIYAKDDVGLYDFNFYCSLIYELVSYNKILVTFKNVDKEYVKETKHCSIL